LSSDDNNQYKKKSKSFEAERLHSNKQYRLENDKTYFTSDRVNERTAKPTRPPAITNKVYDSDVNHPDSGDKSENEMQTLEDDEEFLFYHSRQRSMVEKMCSCFFPYSHQNTDERQSPDGTREDDIKPCGMFGEKTYVQVQEELKAKSVFKNI
jgi:hypothetical protein